MSEIIIDNYKLNASVEKIVETLQHELTNGKLSSLKVTSSGIRVPCPHHAEGKESHPSCYIDTETGMWHCFTCGESGMLQHFVSECFDKDDNFGKKWLISHFGDTFLVDSINIPDFEIPLPMSKCVQKKEQFLDESILDSMQSYHPYMTKRHLTKEVCEKFKIKYDTKSQCLVFPVWDENNNLYMLTKRSVNDKMFYIDKNKEKPVYLLNYIRSNNIKSIMVVESQINALTGWSWNIPSVATFGCNVTSKQMELFNRSNLQYILLCYDGDSAGIKGTKKFLKNIRSDIFVDVVEMPRGKDVNDLTLEEFKCLNIVNSTDWLNKNK